MFCWYKTKNIDQTIHIFLINTDPPSQPTVQFLIFLVFTARADNYRDDGNDLFKKKNYPLAIDNYTEGIKSKSPDAELNAILYTNRAAAQFHLSKYGYSW